MLQHVRGLVAQRCVRAALGVAGREQLAQHGRQRPPAAVVGALVQVAIQHIDQQLRERLAVAQPRAEHGVVQVADGLGEDVVGARAGLANLLQHCF